MVAAADHLDTPSVLIVEDERISRRAMTLLLSANGYPTSAVESAEDAIPFLSNGRAPAIAVIDLDLPGMNGLDLIALIEQLRPDIFPVLVTGADTDRLETALKGRQVVCLRKPVDFHRLLDLLREKQAQH
jgi:two-component system response regulator FlrC